MFYFDRTELSRILLCWIVSLEQNICFALFLPIDGFNSIHSSLAQCFLLFVFLSRPRLSIAGYFGGRTLRFGKAKFCGASGKSHIALFDRLKPLKFLQ